uniref:Olfactory receptor n=1 Tax=Paramormyrops kingsleyae TaxID=1676925 RepID=A0A3B3T5I6_9TELE
MTLSSTNKNETKTNLTSVVTEFVIIGFPGLDSKYYSLMATGFFIIYVTAVAENCFLVVLFVLQPSLQKPMYIIMVSLALSDIGFCTVALPKVIARYWFDDGTISFHVCLFQRQMLHYFGTLTSLIMLIMALDRYVAICFPLRYPALMTKRAMGFLNGFAWVMALICPGITTIQSSQMYFCGSNQILHCFCDTVTINRLACGDISMQSTVALALASFVLMVPFSLIMLSYAHIIIAVLRIASMQGRLKAISTCSTQFCVIGTYYIPRLFVYMSTINTDARIGLVLIYSLLPPLGNPLIYCFRTTEIKNILLKLFCRRHTVSQEAKVSAVSS